MTNLPSAQLARDLVDQSDTVMDILAAQCGDLEALLALARQETEAVEKQDFTKLFEVVSERATLGERLEVYHRQICSLRLAMGERNLSDYPGNPASRASNLVQQILEQDACTRPLLVAAFRDTGERINDVVHKQQRSRAYVHEANTKSLAYDRRV
jgi:flagellar biosynthesis/type III secretory pathway chaperone